MRKSRPRRIRKTGLQTEANIRYIVPIVAALALIAAGCAAPDHKSAGDASPLAALAWLTGEWVAETERSRVRETWQRVSGKTLEGSAVVTLRESGEVGSSETLRIVAMSGAVFYIAKVSENPLPVPFRLTQLSDTRFSFENPGHDFPTRLLYERLGDDQVRVTVSGPDGSGFTLQFRRAD